MLWFIVQCPIIHDTYDAVPVCVYIVFCYDAVHILALATILAIFATIDKDLDTATLFKNFFPVICFFECEGVHLIIAASRMEEGNFVREIKAGEFIREYCHAL